MNDREREERAVWKLEQAGERVQRQAGRKLVTIVPSYGRWYGVSLSWRAT